MNLIYLLAYVISPKVNDENHLRFPGNKRPVRMHTLIHLSKKINVILNMQTKVDDNRLHTVPV